MNWRIKGVVQKALSCAPGGGHINDILQRTVGQLRNVEATIDSKVIDDWAVLAQEIRELGAQINGAEFVEIGTGWFPVLPFCFALGGASKCHTFDLRRHMSRSLTFRTIARLEKHLQRIAQIADVPVEQVRDRYCSLAGASSLPDAFTRAGMEYHAPADASDTGLPDQSVDIVFSSSVFEHVPPTEIVNILREAARVLRPAGVAIHSVNCGDHYAYFDRSITPINYLRYSDREWRFWDNRLLYQNRLRPKDFVDLSREAGLEVALYRYRTKPELLSALRSLKIATRFAGYSPDQLCATSVDFAARPTTVTATLETRINV